MFRSTEERCSYCCSPAAPPVLVVLLLLLWGGAAEGARAHSVAAPNWLQSCESLADRQIQLADRLLGQSKFTQALRVLNRTAENCNLERVRNKILETYDAWFSSVRQQGSPAQLQSISNALSKQAYLSSSQKESIDTRIGEAIRGQIQQNVDAERYQTAFGICREFPGYTSDVFRARYHCGVSALEVGAQQVAIDAYEWLMDNWSEEQSVTTRKETADTLERLYLATGQFWAGYQLAREQATRNTNPQSILRSLVSLRGHMMAPIAQAGGILFDGGISEAAATHVRRELRRVQFPDYLDAFYLLSNDGSVERGFHGDGATPPSSALLDRASDTVSLLRSPGDSNRAWLVRKTEDGYVILEYGTETSPEETVRLEKVLEDVESRDQWRKLYDLEFEQTAPASGSAVATLLAGAYLGKESLTPYRRVFDSSSLLAYYCLQGENGEIQTSHGFTRENLGYGAGGWQRTSNTPALFHHPVTYDGQSMREVVWPRYVDESWSGVTRVALVHR